VKMDHAELLSIVEHRASMLNQQAVADKSPLRFRVRTADSGIRLDVVRAG
jgi:hypothetical protein